MRKSSRILQYIFAAVILPAWIALTGFIVHAAQPFELHLLDVGQGQCVLIEADGHYMLIDGGGRSASSFVVSYLKQQGDEDHMSGLSSSRSSWPDPDGLRNG